MPSPQFLNRDKFGKCIRDLVADELFSTQQTALPQTKYSKPFLILAIFLWQMLYSFVAIVQEFIASIRHVSYTESNHRPSISYSISKKEASIRHLLFREHTCETFPRRWYTIFISLPSSCLESTDIFPIYPNKRLFLPSFLTFIRQPHPKTSTLSGYWLCIKEKKLVKQSQHIEVAGVDLIEVGCQIFRHELKFIFEREGKRGHRIHAIS